MLKRIKKTLTCINSSSGIISKLKSHLLHSDKSAYFYKSKGKGFFNSIVQSFHHRANDIRWTSPHCEQSNNSSDTNYANRTRSSREMMSYSVMTGRTPLVLSAFGLLVVLSMMISPSIDMHDALGDSEVYAAGDQIAPDVPSTPPSTTNMSVSLTMADPDQTTLSNLNAQPGAINYISTGFKVSAANVDKYSIYVQTAPGSTNTLSSGKLSIDFVKEDTPVSGFTDNTWGYNVDATGAKPENLKYNPIPESNTASLNPAYTSTTATEEKDFTLNFAAKFASDAPAGHYSTDIMLSVAAGTAEVATLYTVEYDGKGGNNVPATMSSENTDGSYSITIPESTIPVLNGYSFRGWSTSSTATSANATYDPGKTITLQKANPTLKLYAVWQVVANPLTTLTDMQSMTSSICAQASTPSKWDTISGVPTAYLKDNRDGNFYWIAKLADGNCWMTQNLRLVGSRTLSSSNSDVSSNYTLPASVDPWSDTSVTTNKVHYAGDETKGAYYAWYTATAGTGNSSITTKGQNATSSICPKGWRLPSDYYSTSSTKGPTYRQLTTAYDISSNAAGSQKLRSAPLNFVYGGYVISGKLNNAGSNGDYWSSTADGGTNAYSLHFTSSGVIPSNYYSRYSGMSVRCVAK